MIRCRILLDAKGCLLGFEASGHATAEGEAVRPGGTVDLACAAATTLLRTAARMLYRHPELQVGGGAPEPGLMSLSLEGSPAHLESWLRGVTDFLLAGLRDIEEEHPESLRIVIRRKGTIDHGT